MLSDNTLHDFRFFNAYAKTGEIVNMTPRAAQGKVSPHIIWT